MAQGQPPESADGRWGLLAGVSLLSASLAAYEIVPASVTPTIRGALGVSPAGAGALVSVMFGTAVVASLPAGVVLDRVDSRRAIAVATAAFLAAAGWGWWAATAGDYPSLLLSRVLGGLAYIVIWNAGIDVTGRAFASERQATAVGLVTASGPVGFAVGQGTGAVVAGAFGWPAVFVAFVAPAVVGLAVFWPASRGRGRVREATGTPVLGNLGTVVRTADVWLVGVLGFLAFSLYLFVNTWLPTYLTEDVGLAATTSGLLAAAFPAVGVVGRVGGGVLSDRAFAGRRRPVLFASFLVTTPVVAAFATVSALPILVALILVAGVAVQLCIGLVYGVAREYVPPGAAATAVAFVTATGLLGAFVAPVAFGALLDVAGFDRSFLVAAGISLCGLLLAWRASEPAR